MAGQITPAQQPSAVARPKDIQALIESPKFRDAVAKALPKHLSADRFIRVACTALMRTPKLRTCTQESLLKALLDLSMYGLEPDGRRAHLIPFTNKVKQPGKPDRYQDEVQLIIDYKGLAELVRRSGDVSYIHADVVCEGDVFEFGYGSEAFLKHKPTMEGFRDPKTVKCAYSFVKLKDGSEDFIVLSKGEVEKVRARSRAGQNGPWVSDWNAMAAKTAFRRHSKWLPLSPEVRDAVEADDEVETVNITAEPPDADPGWFQIGSAAAADEVALGKIEELEQAAAARFGPAEATAAPGQSAERPQQTDRIQPEGKPYTRENPLPDAESVAAGTEALYEEDGLLTRVQSAAAEGYPDSPRVWRTVEQVSATAAPPQTDREPAKKKQERTLPTFGGARGRA